MHKLISGEIYRLLHKKSMYAYFAALAAGYFILAFIRSGGFNGESVVSDAMTMFSLLPALAGGFLFAAIYTDDLNSKNLITLVGYGVKKATVIIAKFLLAALFGAVVYWLVPIYHILVYSLLGQTVTADAAAMVYAVSLKYLLVTLAYSALSGIVAYGLQRATFAIVTYLLLAFGVVGSLLAVALRTFAPGLAEHLVSAITDGILLGVISGARAAMPVLEYIVYLLAGLALSAIAFNHKEMEF